MPRYSIVITSSTCPGDKTCRHVWSESLEEAVRIATARLRLMRRTSQDPGKWDRWAVRAVRSPNRPPETVAAGGPEGQS